MVEREKSRHSSDTERCHCWSQCRGESSGCPKNTQEYFCQAAGIYVQPFSELSSHSTPPIYSPEKKKNRNTLLQHLPRAVRSPSAFEFLTNPKNQFKMKRYQFQRSFFFSPPPWGFTVLLCLLNWQELLSSQFAQTQLLQRFRQNTCRAFINQLSQERLFFK